MFASLIDLFRQDEGFKNVSLGNVLSASYGGTKKNTFVSDADNDLLKKFKVRAHLLFLHRVSRPGS